MARRPGKKDDAGGLLFAAGRFVGYCLLTFPALAIIAGVVLLPAYANLQDQQHIRDVEQAELADMESAKTAYDRLIEGVRNDPVLVKRLSMNMLRTLPSDEEVWADPAVPPAIPPGLIATHRYPRPDPPSGAAIRIARRLGNPATGRGLFLLATGAMLTAMFLFAPPQKYNKASGRNA